jgi:hypothetical protein
MKKLANIKNNPEAMGMAVILAVLTLGVLLPDSAFAQGSEQFKAFTKKGTMFNTAITLGFGLFAFIKWIDYFASFSTGNALTGLIVPGIATFLTFQWDTVLKWFNLA